MGTVVCSRASEGCVFGSLLLGALVGEAEGGDFFADGGFVEGGGLDGGGGGGLVDGENLDVGQGGEAVFDGVFAVAAVHTGDGEGVLHFWVLGHGCWVLGGFGEGGF